MLRRWLPVAPALLVLAGLFLFPLAWFAVISLWSVRARMMRPDLTLANYAAAWTEYGDVAVRTLAVAAVVGAVTTAIAFGFAYAIWCKAGRLGPALLFATLVTLFGGYLVKIYAWKSILGRDGILNQLLIGLGLTREPIGAFLYSTLGVVITLVYFLLPFAVLPVYGALRSIEPATLDAARDLGARPARVLRDVVLPQCQGGLMVAFTLCFLITVGDYVTPRFVGGGAAMMGHFIELQFSLGFNWPLGSAMSFSILAASLVVAWGVRQALARALRP